MIIQVDGTERRIWSVWTDFVSKPVAQLLASGTGAADVAGPAVPLPTKPAGGDAAAVGSGSSWERTGEACSFPYRAGW